MAKLRIKSEKSQLTVSLPPVYRAVLDAWAACGTYGTTPSEIGGRFIQDRIQEMVGPEVLKDPAQFAAYIQRISLCAHQIAALTSDQDSEPGKE